VRLDGLRPDTQPHDDRLGGVVLGDLRQARRTDRSAGVPRIATADDEAIMSTKAAIWPGQAVRCARSRWPGHDMTEQFSLKSEPPAKRPHADAQVRSVFGRYIATARPQQVQRSPALGIRTAASGAPRRRPLPLPRVQCRANRFTEWRPGAAADYPRAASALAVSA
jgi:hypothetical protein